MATFIAYCEKCGKIEESSNYERAKDIRQSHAEITGHHIESLVTEQS